MRSHEMFRVQDAPLRPLLVKQLWEIVSGRALWTMLLLVCPLIGYSFFQAMSLYGEASATAQQSQVLARTLSPLDGVLVPTLGASYLAVTLLFPLLRLECSVRKRNPGRYAFWCSCLTVPPHWSEQSSLPCWLHGRLRTSPHFLCSSSGA